MIRMTVVQRGSALGGTAWIVTVDGKEVSSHSTKSAAVADASKRGNALNAKKGETVSLKIHLADGRFEEERTYGKDPNPPRG